MLGLAVILQIRSAIAQQNVITLGNMLRMRPRENMPKRSTLFVLEASNISAVDKTYNFICALRVNKCEFKVYTVRTFMKCRHICAAQKAY